MRWIASLIFGALLLSSVPGLALAHGRGGGHGRHESFGMLLRSAELTEAQKQQVGQIIAAHRPQLKTLMGQIRTAREALHVKLYAPGALTAADVAPELQQIEQLHSQLAQERAQLALEIRGLLTPDQLVKVAQKRQRMQELRREMHDLTR
jgi:Spy/CpxP family protein refolding chaperone